MRDVLLSLSCVSKSEFREHSEYTVFYFGIGGNLYRIFYSEFKNVILCDDYYDLIDFESFYTSKTCSWSGEIVNNLGGKKIVRGSDGVSMSRDVNGARGIYLRALADSPELRSAKESN